MRRQKGRSRMGECAAVGKARRDVGEVTGFGSGGVKSIDGGGVMRVATEVWILFF